MNVFDLMGASLLALAKSTYYHSVNASSQQKQRMHLLRLT